MSSILVLSLAVSAAFPAAADDKGLEACRRLDDRDRRLACYDALPLTSTATARPAVDAASAPAAAPVAVAPPVQTAAQFGFESRTRGAALDVIESTLPGRFEGWEPRGRIRLANGQVWQIADDSSAALVRKDPKVWIRRGALGVFYLEIEGTNRTPRVVRVE